MLYINNTILVCIDVQESLAQVMFARDTMITSLKKLIAGVSALGIPIIWTEQNPQKLGPTVSEIAEMMPAVSPVSKMSFSCCGSNAFMEALRSSQRQQVLLSGIEAHVCVYQTAVELMGEGYELEVVVDCISSRTLDNRSIGIEKMRHSGAGLTTTEIVLFELLRTAEAPKFKDIARIIR